MTFGEIIAGLMIRVAENHKSQAWAFNPQVTGFRASGNRHWALGNGVASGDNKKKAL